MGKFLEDDSWSFSRVHSSEAPLSVGLSDNASVIVGVSVVVNVSVNDLLSLNELL